MFPLVTACLTSLSGGCLATGCVVKILEHNLLLTDPTLPYTPPTSRPPAPLALPVAVLLSYPALDFNFTSWMTPSHLKVLREETEADEHRQHAKSPSLLRRHSSFFYSSDDDGGSEGWAKELRGAKDHLSHANPLAMVNEGRKPSSPVRKKSWRDTFGMGMTSITGPATSAPIMKRSKSRRSYSQLHAQTAQLGGGNLRFTDSSSEEDDDDEEGEEHRPIEARIRWQHPQVSNPVTPSHDRTLTFDTLCPQGSGVQEILNTDAQARLAAEVLRANVEVAKRRKRAASERKNAPIGMRLTMTSRSGYFQDRIISPTMVSCPTPLMANNLEIGLIRCVRWPSYTSALILTPTLRQTITSHLFLRRRHFLQSFRSFFSNVARRIHLWMTRSFSLDVFGKPNGNAVEKFGRR